MDVLISHSLIAILVVATVLVNAASAAAFHEFAVPGTCPYVNELKLWTEQKDTHWKLGGDWYWHSYTPSPYQPIAKCVKMRLQYDAESTFRTFSVGLDINGEPMQTQGTIYPNVNREPKFTIAQETAPPAPIAVLDTDYQNYACLYSCQDFGGRYHGDFAFVYSRTPKMDPAYAQICEDVFSKVGMDLSRFMQAYKEDDCPSAEEKTI